MAAEDWTEEKIKVLTRMWTDGCTCSEIGAVIGKTRNAVIGKRTRIGLPDRGQSTLKHRSKGGMVRVRKPSAPEKRVLVPWHLRELREFEAKMKAAAPQPQPVKQAHDAGPAPLMIPLLDLTDQMCRWPVNSPERGDEFLFCAHEKERGSPYCSFHESIAWVGRPHARATRPMRKAA